MSAKALYNMAMNPADAFDYTREALKAAGAVLNVQTPPAHIEFSLTRKDVETGSIDAVMPGRALIAASENAQATVTVVVDPATQFIVYAVSLGLAALLLGALIFSSFSGLWFVVVLAGEAYLFWAIFTKWPADAQASIRAKMQASPSVTGGAIVVEKFAMDFQATSPPRGNSNDVADQIRKLAELRDQGHITQAEFEAKKTELLSRI